MSLKKIRKEAGQILNGAIESVSPLTLIEKQVKIEGNVLHLPTNIQIDLNSFERIFICGAGKASGTMTRAMEKLLGERLWGGEVIVKYGHKDKLEKVKQHEAGHPIPDENTLQATEEMLMSLNTLTEKDCVIVLITGGGSALMEKLPKTITLEDLQSLSGVLLQCGATIHEINCIRKHISEIKGGQLARNIFPAKCITLILSDVIGDNFSVIASGPTSPDPSTFSDALAILRKFKINNQIPKSIFEHLQKGVNGKINETPKKDDKIFKSVTNVILGNNRLALLTARDKAEELGYNTLVLTSMLQGEAKEIAHVFSSVIKEIYETDMPINKPACLLAGGEPTVQIKGDGKGGRNQELALALALTNIENSYVFFSCGSDGTDGPTDAAGAIVDNHTLIRAKEAGLDPQNFLQNNDAYNFFNPLNDLIITGPTGTNVMDIICAIIP